MSKAVTTALTDIADLAGSEGSSSKSVTGLAANQVAPFQGVDQAFLLLIRAMQRIFSFETCQARLSVIGNGTSGQNGARCFLLGMDISLKSDVTYGR